MNKVKEQGYPVSVVAEWCGVSPRSVYRWLKGDTSPTVQQALIIFHKIKEDGEIFESYITQKGVGNELSTLQRHSKSADKNKFPD